MSSSIKQHLITSLVVAIWSVAGATANADVVCDWNATAGDIVVASKPPAPISYRAMAIVQSAVYEAVNAITRRYPPDGVAPDAAPGASVDAAVAAVNRAILVKLAPSQQAAIDSAARLALSAIPTARRRRKGSQSAKGPPSPSCRCAPTMAATCRKATGLRPPPASTCQRRYRRRPNGRVASHGS